MHGWTLNYRPLLLQDDQNCGCSHIPLGPLALPTCKYTQLYAVAIANSPNKAPASHQDIETQKWLLQWTI